MQDAFAACRDPTPILALEETASTNVEAMRLAAAGESGPLWISARRQTAGRGREGRDWTSLEGNLHASLLVTLWMPPTVLPQLSLLAGVALAEAVLALIPKRCSQASRPNLKWPNDLLFGEAKCAGILVETTARPGGAFNCVLGFGANISQTPEVPGRSVTSLAAEGIRTTAADLLAALDRNIRRGFCVYSQPDGLATLHHNWLAHAHPAGTPLTVKSGSETIAGSFAGLDPDGALLLRDGTGSLRRIAHGDVSAGGSVV